MAEGLGDPFYILSPGIGLKKYPSCYHTHRAIEATLNLVAEHHLTEQDIDEVEVGTSERACRVMAFNEPATPYQGKFSMPHCIAAALVEYRSHCVIEINPGLNHQLNCRMPARVCCLLSNPN